MYCSAISDGKLCGGIIFRSAAPVAGTNHNHYTQIIITTHRIVILRAETCWWLLI